MAEQLSLIRLIELGFELCGTYSLPTGGSTSPDKGFYDRAPLTTTKKLHTFITTMPGTKGHKKAVRAAKYILNCSASPMETKLAMLLTLPHNLGGYGFKAPALNSRIAAERTAAKTAGKSFYSCDLFWQDHLLAVEYDSDTFHTGSQRIAEDSKRRNTLAAMGISVITVTWQQLYQTDEFEQVASVLALHMSKKLKPVSQSLTNKHKELRDQLLGSQYDGY
ncbi:MAG: hypothetical protein FWD45_02970 [Coriobacteriia bacterium]|nr:hypothetical protein [Coriobacteriia bacterium]